MNEQPYLNFDAVDDECHAQANTTSLRVSDLRRAVLGWLAENGAAGAAIGVATRKARFRADVAGFWNTPVRNPDGGEKPAKLLTPTRTAIVECRNNRNDCWPDYAKSSLLLPALSELKAKREALEAQLRDQEPYLKESSILFDEYSDWNYAATDNTEYHNVCRRIARIEDAVYQGTRFELLSQSTFADHLYLAVPEHVVEPDELADGWGLLWINDALGVTVVREATSDGCPFDNLVHLVQNIASASMKSVLFAYGVDVDADGPVFRRPPRRRRVVEQSCDVTTTMPNSDDR